MTQQRNVDTLTWEQKEISLKLFSIATFLVSGLIKKICDRPTWNSSRRSRVQFYSHIENIKPVCFVTGKRMKTSFIYSVFTSTFFYCSAV